MITPEDVIAEARSWIGTPFLHQGRNHLGIDCVGLPIVTGWRLGYFPDDLKTPAYGRLPNKGQLEQEIDAYCDRLGAPVAGCLVAFAWHKESAHVGIYTGTSVIHAYQKRGKVIEHGFRGKWLDRVSGVWALPGVSY